MNLQEVLKQWHDAFVRFGFLGIRQIAETDDCWIIQGYAENEGALPDNPIIIDKKNGKARVAQWTEKTDRQILYNCQKIDLPEEYLVER